MSEKRCRECGGPLPEAAPTSKFHLCGESPSIWHASCHQSNGPSAAGATRIARTVSCSLNPALCLTWRASKCPKLFRCEDSESIYEGI
jgi:hypothetical protein